MLTELYKSTQFAYLDHEIFGGRLAFQADKQATHKISCYTRDYIEFEIYIDEFIANIWDQIEVDT